MSLHSMAWINNSELLDTVFGASSEQKKYPSHVMQPLLRSSFLAAQADPVVKYCFSRTSRTPFRTPLDIYPIGFIIYWNLLTGRATARYSSDDICLFHDLEPGDNVKGLMSFINRKRPALFCINDGGYTATQGKVLIEMLFKIFPDVAPWEPSYLTS